MLPYELILNCTSIIHSRPKTISLNYLYQEANIFLQLFLALEYFKGLCDSVSFSDLEGKNLSSMCSFFFFFFASFTESKKTF